MNEETRKKKHREWKENKESEIYQKRKKKLENV